MILPTTASAVWILAIVSLLCLGSWANTLKLAGKWRFEYFYYDFVLGILLCAGVAALALGSGRAQELTFQDNLLLAGKREMAWALGSGVMLNLGMLLLLAAMTIAGMSVAFPLTLGVALVIGAIWDFANATQANTPLTFMGVALLAGAVVVSRPNLHSSPAGPARCGAEGADAGSTHEVEARQAGRRDADHYFVGCGWNRTEHVPENSGRGHWRRQSLGSLLGGIIAFRRRTALVALFRAVLHHLSRSEHGRHAVRIFGREREAASDGFGRRNRVGSRHAD